MYHVYDSEDIGFHIVASMVFNHLAVGNHQSLHPSFPADRASGYWVGHTMASFPLLSSKLLLFEKVQSFWNRRQIVFGCISCEGTAVERTDTSLFPRRNQLVASGTFCKHGPFKKRVYIYLLDVTFHRLECLLINTRLELIPTHSPNKPLKERRFILKLKWKGSYISG